LIKVRNPASIAVQRAISGIDEPEAALDEDLTLPAEQVRDRANRDVSAAGVLSATPLTYFMRQDDSDLVVFCFANPEDAEAFVAGVTLKTSGRPERVIQDNARRRTSRH
jgi:hypothetical protein